MALLFYTFMWEVDMCPNLSQTHLSSVISSKIVSWVNKLLACSGSEHDATLVNIAVPTEHQWNYMNMLKSKSMLLNE